MKLWCVFRKSLREQIRDPLTLSLSLVFAPIFVLLYWMFTYGGSTSYGILVINQDLGAKGSDGVVLAAGEEAIQAIEGVTYPDGNPILRVMHIDSRAEAESLLKNRQATAFIAIPEDFSQTIQALQEGDRSVTTQIIFGGDMTNPYYMFGAIFSTAALDSYIQQASGQTPIVQYIEEPLATSAARTEFENYVPGIFIFSVIMLVFLASMCVAREIEVGTLRRLQITRMTSLDLLGGISLALLMFSIIAILITFITAVALGFRSQGALWVAIVIGCVTCLSIIGVGMVVASFSRSVSQAFIIANFPLGLFMFFSGAMFPIPRVNIFHIGGRAISLYELLPPTHAVAALNKVFTSGAGMSEVSYELSALLVLSALYFGAGVWIFKRRHLRT